MSLVLVQPKALYKTFGSSFDPVERFFYKQKTVRVRVMFIATLCCSHIIASFVPIL